MLGSVTKTYTATAPMRLVAEVRVELEATLRRYLPELRLVDEGAAAEVTLLNLLNHTSGLDWGIIVDTGKGGRRPGALCGKVGRWVCCGSIQLRSCGPSSVMPPFTDGREESVKGGITDA